MKKLTIIGIALLTQIGAGQAAESIWPDPLSMYRAEIKLGKQVSGEVEIALPIESILAAARAMSPELVEARDFAFEKVILVDPGSGKIVGRFELAVDQKDLLINGDLQLGEDGMLPGWSGFDPPSMEQSSAMVGETQRSVLFIKKAVFTNSRLSQVVRLKAGSWYLFQHWQWRDGSDSPIIVQAIDPEKRLFRRDFSSFVPAYLPPGEWVFNEELLLPRKNLIDVEISTAYVGRQGTSALSLQSVRWVLKADLPTPTDTLEMYWVGRAGHILTTPGSVGRVSKSLPTVAAEISGAESRFADSVKNLGSDDRFQLWTLPSDYPLRESFLAKLCPPATEASEPGLRMKTFRGGWVSVPVVVKSGSPLLQVRKAEGSAPFPIKVEKLGLIPVYDGPVGVGKWIQNRFDALMPVADRQFTPAREGQHVLVVTCHVPESSQPGKYHGSLELELGHQTGDVRKFSLPLEIEVADIILRPQRDFFTIFGNEQWMSQMSTDLVTPSVGASEFHGLTAANRMENPDDPTDADPRRSRIGRTSRAYSHAMLDNWLSPQSPALFAPYSYSVEERGPGQAPRLVDFNFESYDEAIREFVIERDMPWVSIHNTNGHLMDSFRLKNGVTYTLRDVPETETTKPLSEDEYFRLVGDYMEAMALHFKELGILDRALLVIDESAASTYPIMLKYRRALQGRPHAKEIRFLHTGYSTAPYTQRTEDGKRIMEKVVDFPAMLNDDHFDFLAPDIDWKPEREGGQMWAYYVETDHWNLFNAGLSTVLAPQKLTYFGVSGWYCWGSYVWSLPYARKGFEEDGVRFTSGPVVNPWLNPFYHHGPGVISFFYPPDPKGVPDAPTEKVIPSYRLYLMRDGLQNVAWQKVLDRGVDDGGQELTVDREAYDGAVQKLNLLWTTNPVQWYLGYAAYDSAMELMRGSLKEL